MRAYKLLGRYEDRLVSLCYLNHRNPGIIYEEGRANTAEFPLFVFRELEKAKYFWDTHILFPLDPIELWEVEAVNLRPMSKVARDTYTPDVVRFWTTRNKEELDIAVDSPEGTYICDYLTLVKRIE